MSEYNDITQPTKTTAETETCNSDNKKIDTTPQIKEFLDDTITTTVNTGKQIIKDSFGIDTDQISKNFLSTQSSDDVEIKYNVLLDKLQIAKSNNEYIELYKEFYALEGYGDAANKCEYCLSKVSFNNADELKILGSYYTKLKTDKTVAIGTKCIDISETWKSYELSLARFNDTYNAEPLLSKLWKKYSTAIIIIGIVTLLWGFIIFGGALLIEKTIRIAYLQNKKKTPVYIAEKERLHAQKNELDKLLSELKNATAC